MRGLVEAAKRDPVFRRTVSQVLDLVPGHDHAGEIFEIVEFTRDRVRYQRDPSHLELFQSPQVLLRDALRGRAAGDCDDLVLLCGAMLEVVGHPIRFRVGALRPGVYSHIWLDVRGPNGWTPIELTRYARVGWSPADRFPIVLNESLGEFAPGGRSPGGSFQEEDQLMSISYRTRPGGRVSMPEYYPPRESTYYRFLPSDIMRQEASDQLGEFEPDETWGWVYEWEWVPDGLGGWGKKLKKRFKKIRKRLKKRAKKVWKRYGKKALIGTATLASGVFTGGMGAGLVSQLAKAGIQSAVTLGAGYASGQVPGISQILGGGAESLFGPGGAGNILAGKVTGGLTDLFSVGAVPYEAVRSWMEEALPFAKGRIPGFEKLVPKMEARMKSSSSNLMTKWLGLGCLNGWTDGRVNGQTMGRSNLEARRTPVYYGSATLAGFGGGGDGGLGVLPTGAARIFAPDFEYWIDEYAGAVGIVTGQDQYKGRERKSAASIKWEADQYGPNAPISKQLKWWDALFAKAGVKAAWDKVKNQPWSVVRQKMPPNAVDWYPANNAPWTRYWLQIVMNWYKVEAWSPGDQGVGRRVALMGPIINNLFAEFITAAGKLKKKGAPPPGGAGAPPPPPPSGSSNQAKIDYLNKLLANLQAQLKAAAASAAAGAANLAAQLKAKIAAALAAKTNLLATVPAGQLPGGTDQLRRELEQIKRDRAKMAAALLQLQKQQAARGRGAPGPVPEGGLFAKFGGAGGVGALAIGAAAILALFMRRQ